MQIIYEENFINSFNAIWDYISLDSKKQANNFKSNIKKVIEDMPYKCRKSIYFEDDNIRDLIFKGYTVVYKVDKAQKTIIIIGIKKYQNEL